MAKKKLGVIFGGMSTENEVSVLSAESILNNLDRERYEVFPIYIDKKGNWFKYIENGQKREFGAKVENKEKIDNLFQYLKGLDVVFPVLHGLYGEDGTIQGLFELLKIPYVGCKVLASSVGMDKVYTKIVFEKAGLNQTPYEYVRKCNDKYIHVDKNFNESIITSKEAAERISKSLKFPMFVKPSNSGSSVGVRKTETKEELIENIEYAGSFDKKVIIEQGINGKEVECAVLGNENVIASCVGEIKAADEFYSYDAKYKNEESKTKIPANISEELSNEIRNEAIKAFKSIDGKGLSRVFEASGLPYKELLTKLIELAME